MRDIAVLGAGPYGLSLAAYLAQTGADVRVFGHAMRSWTAHMPSGMHLKSEGFASTLYDPGNSLRFSHYCKDKGIGYADVGLPVSLADFAAYGLTFQRRFVPHLEPKLARLVKASSSGFSVTFDDGEVAQFRRVVLAIGIQPFSVKPRELEDLPTDLVSHSAAHHDMSSFAGRRVVIVGGGSSATDCAASLAAAGADVEIVARVPELQFHAPPKPRRWFDNLVWPTTTIGTGWRSAFCTATPDLFYALPQHMRHEITRRHLGPVGCWFTRDLIMSKVRVHGGSHVLAAEPNGKGICLTILQDGRSRVIETDHIITATGYKVDVDRLTFLDSEMRSRIATAEKTPILSRHFESSVPGLFFTGVTAANMFGPLLRFACGAEFASTRLTRHLAPRRSRGARTKPGRTSQGTTTATGDVY